MEQHAQQLHTETRWFRSAPVSPEFNVDNIDAEAGIIRDVVMVQEGEAKGHGVHLESEFVEALVRYDKANFSKIGLKARFGHPSASSETMGTQMGVFHNFRKREKDEKMQAIADLHLLEAADESPTHPGMRSWVLKMAGERPDFIMSSIVFRGSGFYQRKPNGNKHRLEPATDWMDEYPWKNYKEEWGEIFVEFDADNGAEHFYTDLVESGAATDQLFGTRANPDLFVSRAHQFLDDNPDLKRFIQQYPDKVAAFLARLGITVQHEKKMSKTTSLMDWLFGNSEQQPEPTAEELSALKTQLGATKGQIDARLTALQTQIDEFKSQVAALKADAEQLRADIEAHKAEIAELKKQPGAQLTAGEGNPPAPTPKPRAYQTDPVTQRAQRFAKTEN